MKQIGLVERVALALVDRASVAVRDFVELVAAFADDKGDGLALVAFAVQLDRHAHAVADFFQAGDGADIGV